MPEDADRQLTERALALGLLSREQVQACRQAVALGESGTVLDAALRAGYLARLQAVRIQQDLLPDDVPRELGRYRIIQRLGKGGMGAVYKAYDPELDRYAAIKTLIPELASNATFIARFKREGRLAARLSSEHAVRVHDVGQEENAHYIVMEFVEGESFEKRLDREGTLDETSAFAVCADVVRALIEAREHNIIHRDIKPQNIMINRKGVVKLADLGIAKQIEPEDSPDGASDLSLTVGIIGTPKYMSPEQAMGKPLDFRTDIFSLGATLHHFVCGAPPHTADTPQMLMMKVAQEPAPDPRSANPHLSDTACAVLRKMTAQKPEDRYNALEALLSDLQKVAGGLVPATEPDQIPPTRSAPPSVPAAAIPPPRRRRLAPVAIGAAALLLILAVACAWIIKAGRARPHRTTDHAATPRRQPEPTFANNDEAYKHYLAEARAATRLHERIGHLETALQYRDGPEARALLNESQDAARGGPPVGAAADSKPAADSRTAPRPGWFPVPRVKIRRPLLGASVCDPSSIPDDLDKTREWSTVGDLLEVHHLKRTDKGALVVGVSSGSLAVQAGFNVGDLIVQYAGSKIESAEQFISAVGRTPPGATVPIKVIRMKRPVTLVITLPGVPGESFKVPRLGAAVCDAANVTDQIARRAGAAAAAAFLANYRLKSADKGAVIVEVLPRTPAADAGLRTGDLIVQFDGQNVDNARRFLGLVADTPSDRMASVLFHRWDRSLILFLPAARSRRGRPRKRPRLPGVRIALPAHVTIADAKQAGAQTVEGLLDRFRVRKTDPGVLVLRIFWAGPIRKAGFMRGDLIVEAGGRRIANPRELRHAVTAVPADKPVQIKVTRWHHPFTCSVRLRASRTRTLPKTR